MAIRFDAEKVELSNKMRLVAHVGFIDGAPLIPASAEIRVQVVIGDRATPKQLGLKQVTLCG